MVDNPYLVDTPFVFHFSGGRTSGYLLKHVLDAYGGEMPLAGLDGPGWRDVRCPIVFTNTGKEFEETLSFVERCSREWGVHIHWVEWTNKKLDGKGYRVVNFESASRQGEPFESLIASKNYLPNVVQRLCTQHLKILACDRFLFDYWRRPDYTGVTGIRYDEPKRWKSGGQDSRNSHRITVHPLRWARVDQQMVLDWWKLQPFDLGLQPHESNCDLCFLKSNDKRIQIMMDHPDKVDWWIAQEEKNRNRNGEKARTNNYRAGFRGHDRKNYQQLYEISLGRVLGGDETLSFDGEEDLIDCNCTD